MRSVFRRVVTSIILLLSFGIAVAQSFVVKQIQVIGLQNLATNTVLNYLPIHPGQTFNSEKSTEILESLYKTGFFYTASLGQRNNTLIIMVKERPMITLVDIEGNKEVSTDKVTPVLKKVGVFAGNIYDPMKLQLFNQSLEQQYAVLGYAATSVTSNVKNVSHNRVAVYIKVNEGKIVKVHAFHITGNKSFSQHKLVRQLELTTPGILTWITKTDRFSELKLSQDLQTLSNFYLNNGYVQFRVLSHREVFSADHKHVDIYIDLSEGPVYRISGYKIIGDTKNSGPQLAAIASFKSGDIFSRQKIIDTQKAINTFFADKAYAFATVQVQPTVDNLNHTVFVTFNITPGKRVYVRQIKFTGNSNTNELVLRREMRQMEAAPYALSRINEGKRRLMMTQYFSNVTVTPVPVAGTNNQVDLNYAVKEQPSGKASLQGGYSSAYGFLYGASITQPNFLGSGKYVSIGFTNSQVTQNYYFAYVNPYYTWYGVSRGFKLSYNRNKYNKSFGYAPYVMDSMGGDLIYGFPLSENNSIGVDFGYARIDLKHIANDGSLAPSVINFITSTPGSNAGANLSRDYNATSATVTWTYDARDQSLMPTQGLKNQLGLTLGAPLLSNNLSYYTITDNFASYIPLYRGFVLSFLANFGYGAGFGSGSKHLLPFIYNFYAGGIGTVPGFQNNTLGPQYAPGTPNGSAGLGGNLLTTAGVHLILPNFISNTVRIALTFDAGNVFQAPLYGPDTTQQYILPNNTATNLVVQDETFALRNIRMSAGILVTWIAPMMGPIDLSLAFPLNKKPYDQIENFQFAMGVSF